jgi:hypothetical protein
MMTKKRSLVPWSARCLLGALLVGGCGLPESSPETHSFTGARGAVVGEKPGPGNTGPSNPSLLQPRSGMTITQAGAIIENVDITGTVDIRASNVTLRNFRINTNGGFYGIKATSGATGILLEDGEVFNAQSSNIYGGGFTARRLNVHDSGGDGFKATGNVVVEDSWIHHLGKSDGAHADGNQSRKGDNFIFRRNNCDMPTTDPAPYKTNACFMLQEADGPLTRFLIEDNWLNGGNFTIYCAGDTTVRNNRFGRNYRYGVKNGCSNWSGNVWEDTGAAIP